MPSLLVLAHLKTKGGADREKVIAALTRTAEYTEANEPGVAKYFMALLSEDDGTSVFAIEEYGSQSIMDIHMVSPAVKDLLSLFGSSPTLFSGPPTIYGLPSKLSPSGELSRPSLLQVKDPVIVISHIASKGQDVNAMIKEVEANEKGTLLLTVVEDREKGFVRTVAAYESEAAAEKGIAKGRGAEVWKLKKISGFLGREGSKARL